MSELKNKFQTAQTNYITLRAENETLKEIERVAEVKILKNNEFYTEVPEDFKREIKSERILDPSSSYEMYDKDFQTFLDLRYEALKKYIPSREMVIEYKVRKPLKEAADKLIKIGYELLNRDSDENVTDEQIENISQHWKYRDEAIELMRTVDCNTIK